MADPEKEKDITAAPKSSATNSEPDKSLAELSEYLKNLAPRQQIDPQSVWGRFWYAVSSGLFFLILGLAILLFANYRMSDHHASFTFVLVVLGVALSLFGTGTQGIATIDVSPDTAARIKASLVGGAGTIAIIVGIGMAYWRVDIQQTFGIEKKYLRLVVESGTGNSLLSAYVSQFQYDGRYVPSNYVSENQIEILIPFDEAELPWNHKNGSKEFSIDVVGLFVKRVSDLGRPSSPDFNRDLLLESEKRVSFNSIIIKHEYFLVQARGFSFPKHPKPLQVNLEVRRNTKEEAEKALQDKKPEAQRLNLPPVIIPEN